ncbi:MAG: hypothetical protein M5U19_10545 [Microthrixaceae bacterium]|nr:hypothetical protein [Microthrixaceae bacterium]
MKILAVTSRFPYPIERGDKLRAHYQLRELARHHEVVLVALSEGEVDRSARAVIDEMGIRSHVVSRSRISTVMSTGAGLVTGRPLQVGYFSAPGTRREVHRIIEREQPDHLYCQLLRTAWAVDGLSLDATIDYQDAFAAAMRRRANQHGAALRRVFEFEADRIGAAEAEAFEAFSRRVVISEQDRDCLRSPTRWAWRSSPTEWTPPCSRGGIRMLGPTWTWPSWATWATRPTCVPLTCW